MSFTLHGGSSALLVSLPHIGTDIPAELQQAYVPRALAVEDTDWHLERLCASAGNVSHVLNGRLKGGYITRRYGSPQDRVHAVQLQMCQYLYLREEAPFDYDLDQARQIQPLLKTMMASALTACRGANRPGSSLRA